MTRTRSWSGRKYNNICLNLIEFVIWMKKDFMSSMHFYALPRGGSAKILKVWIHTYIAFFNKLLMYLYPNLKYLPDHLINMSLNQLNDLPNKWIKCFKWFENVHFNRQSNANRIIIPNIGVLLCLAQTKTNYAIYQCFKIILIEQLSNIHFNGHFRLYLSYHISNQPLESNLLLRLLRILPLYWPTFDRGIFSLRFSIH